MPVQRPTKVFSDNYNVSVLYELTYSQHTKGFSGDYNVSGVDELIYSQHIKGVPVDYNVSGVDELIYSQHTKCSLGILMSVVSKSQYTLSTQRVLMEIIMPAFSMS